MQFLNFLKNKFNYLFYIFVFLMNSIPVYSKVNFREADYYQKTEVNKSIVVGRGEILSSESPVSRIALTDPATADIQLLNDREIFVRAKNLGRTTLLVWERNNSSPSRFEISVIPDIEELKKQLAKLDPGIIVEYIPPTNNSGNTSLNENVESLASMLGGPTVDQASGDMSSDQMSAAITNPAGGLGTGFPTIDVTSTAGGMISGGRVVLTGEVKNADVIAKAIQIAGGFVGDTGIRVISQAGGQIINGGPGGGDYDLVTTGGGTTGSAFGGRVRDTGISFTSNRNANISRGIIITTDNGMVVSFMKVKDQPQLAVTIRFYEISRSVTRNIGANVTAPGKSAGFISNLAGAGVSNISGFVSGTTASNTSPDFIRSSSILSALGNNATTAIFLPNLGFGLTLQALQERGEVKSLAEPTLIIANGEPASFLAGGEIPVLNSVVNPGGTAQTITFEPFGIRVTILPTIKEDDSIHLQLIPEIREIDTELSTFVSLGTSASLRPPAFKTRRTETQVELRSGEAFAISGLLSEQNTRSLRKMPGTSEIPVLGSLFRSKAFRRGETELLIVVAPEIVRATKPEAIAQLNLEKDTSKEDYNMIPKIQKPETMVGDEEGPSALEVPINPSRYHGDPAPESINPVTRKQLELQNAPIPKSDSTTKNINNNQLAKLTEELDAKKLELKQIDNLIKQKNNEVTALSSDSVKRETIAIEKQIKEKNIELEKVNNTLNQEEKGIEKVLNADKNNLNELRSKLVEFSNESQEKIEIINQKQKKLEYLESALNVENEISLTMLRNQNTPQNVLLDQEKLEKSRRLEARKQEELLKKQEEALRKQQILEAKKQEEENRRLAKENESLEKTRILEAKKQEELLKKQEEALRKQQILEAKKQEEENRRLAKENESLEKTRILEAKKQEELLKKQEEALRKQQILEAKKQEEENRRLAKENESLEKTKILEARKKEELLKKQEETLRKQQILEAKKQEEENRRLAKENE